MSLVQVHDRLAQSAKWWVASRAVLVKAATVLLGLLLALRGKDPDQALALVTQALDQLGLVVGGAAGFVATLIALEDMARNLFVTAPKDVPAAPAPEVKP